MRIEQLLHGYQDGHGRLAGSLYNLSPNDSARISMMSDWSGFKDPAGNDNSYITSYFLEDSKLYVVAKSWYAHEMERPGCVWTHSLLIDITQLPLPFDFRILLSLFSRPQKGEYGIYNKVVEIKDEDMKPNRWEGKRPDRVSLMFILSTLLAGEERFYMKVELEPWWYQQLCLTILQYLPQEILKRTSLSSGGASPRKIDEVLLSMQFVSNVEAMSLLSPPWTGKLAESDFNIGLTIVARAMMGDTNDVSTLIRVFSKDIGDEGKKYTAVCQLIGALYLGVRKKTDVHYQDILGIVVSNFPASEDGGLIKENFLGEKISSLFCTEEEFLFIIATTDRIEDHVLADQMGLDMRINDLAKSGGYVSLIRRILTSDILSGYGRSILMSSFNYLDRSATDSLTDEQWKGLLAFWGQNHDYLFSDKWMKLRGERFNEVLWRFSKINNDEFPYWSELLKTILTNDAYIDDTLVDKLYQHVEDCASQVLDYLNVNDKLLRYDNLHVRPFRDVETLISWLSRQNKITSLVEELIVNYVWPSDYHLKQSNPLIWHWMIENDNGAKRPSFYVFMYEIAWQWKGDVALEFFYHCFHQVHNGLADSVLSERIWNRVYRYGGSVSFFQEWDRCLKLKKGIVAHLKDIGFGRDVFEKFTPNERINESLVSIFDKMK